MSVLRSIDLRCPVCETRFRTQAVMATNAFGGKHTDFREISSGVQPLAYQVHRCDECGFAGSERDFSEDASVSPLLRAQLQRELAAPTGGPAGQPVPASEKYEVAARIAAWQGSSARQVGEMWLRAAWCSADEHDLEAERYFRIRAARTLEDGLATYDGIAREERAVITYLIGELWRRAGDTARAATWFDLVPDELTDPREQAWITNLAAQQRDRPREWLA